MTKFLNISTDNTLGGNSPSDDAVSSQKAIKAYVDSHATGSPSWGSITGTLSDQTDLKNALDAKYDASNPNGYTSNVGTVTSVNNVSPVNGNVTISIPSEVTESTVSGWGFTKNTGTVTSVNNVSPVNGNVSLNIPTVNNATLTLTQGGTTKGTFTANASSNVTIDLDSGGGSVNVDNKSITTNSSDEIQTVGVINSRDSSTAIKTWSGTKAQYDAIVTKDSSTLYNITDDTDVNLTILEALYPVGSIYETTNATCPLTSLISGSIWVEETSRVLVEKKVATNNDPTWYNLYSDGWCEQGGIVNYTSDSLTTVDLSKTYTDTDYCIQITIAIVGSAAISDTLNAQRFSASNVTVSSFQVRGNGTNTYNRQSWFACGYTSTTTTHKRFRRTA